MVKGPFSKHPIASTKLSGKLLGQQQPTTDLEELECENANLQKELARVKKKLATQKKMINANVEASTVPKVLIPKPKGEAGRGDCSSKEGFSLQKAMGLEENSMLYREVRVSFTSLP